MNMSHTYIVGIGSNFNKELNVRLAQDILAQRFPEVLFSEVLQTDGVGVSEPCVYYNGVALIKDNADPESLKAFLKSAEERLGRRRGSSTVAIDLDIISVDGEIVHKDFGKYPFLKHLMAQVQKLV